VSAERGFADFTAAWERGERPDPAAAIAAAAQSEREPLAAMIAAYVAAHPRADVSAEEVAARAADPRSEPPAAWSELLPALRERTGTTRGALVKALAAALGHPEARAQVEEHVHDLETGRLAPRRVRQPVVAALARILHVPEALLERGRRLPPPHVTFDLAAPVFQRQAPLGAPEPAAAAPDAAERVATIDDLFTGADG
jgi:hypothetical protein